MIEHALIISFMVLFLHSTTWEGMIFQWVKKIIPPEGMLYKPIYGCPICMMPWWGTALYWIFYHHSVKDWILTVGAAGGIAVLFVVLLTEREAAVKELKE